MRRQIEKLIKSYLKCNIDKKKGLDLFVLIFLIIAGFKNQLY